MQSIAFAAPLLPGKTDADLEAMASVSRGERRRTCVRDQARERRTPETLDVAVLCERPSRGRATQRPARRAVDPRPAPSPETRTCSGGVTPAPEAPACRERACGDASKQTSDAC